jgi:glycosyltransferase involved in cell wall biosynthesis
MPLGAPRVLQVALSLNPGGTERLVVELAARLNDDLPTMICCLDELGSWAREAEARGVQVRALRRKPGFNPSLGLALARLAREHDAGVIHAHHYSPFVYGCLARLRHPSMQLVFTEHGRLSDTPPSRKRRAANRLLARCPRRVFTVSEDLRRHLVAEGFSGSAVSVIYNGIAVGPLPTAAERAAVRRELGLADGVFVIGSIGRLDAVKDFGTLIEAVARLPSAINPTLVIVGDGPERARLETLARSESGPPRVRFLGHRDDARAWLAGCDVYVNCSVSEGISLTILEGMAAGLPIVATRVGGTPEIVDDSCGRLIAPRSSLVLADTLQAFAEHPALRGELGLAARRRVEDRFTLERMVGEYRDVYLSTSRSPGSTP